MISSLSDWRPRNLLVAWVAYWILALTPIFGPAIPLLWRLTRAGAHGSVAASAENGVFALTVASGAEVWTRHLSYGMLTLILIGPPLLLWIAWAATRPRRVA